MHTFRNEDMAHAAVDPQGRRSVQGAHTRQESKNTRTRTKAHKASITSGLFSGIPFIATSLKREELKRQRAGYRAELPKLFEIIALGMRVGLGFDQAFALYVKGFATPLALQCRQQFEVWERGLITRESGLRNLAKHIGLKEFDRFVSLTLRALDYGAPLASLLGNLASDARKSYRADRQEMVAKAPVKMLLPTGALILPAMMMLVIGPIILDITERMV